MGVSSLASKVRAIERTTALKKTLLLEVESRSGELAPVGPPRGVCYVCGQRTASPSALKWHIAKCLKRWKMDQDLLPHKMLRAKRPPPRPSLPVPNAPGPLLHAWNRQAALVYLLDCTPRCKGCGKAFATQQKVGAFIPKQSRQPLALASRGNEGRKQSRRQNILAVHFTIDRREEKPTARLDNR